MINAMKKKVLIAVLALLSLVLAFGGVSGFVNAKANTEPKSLSEITFTMDAGANVRLDGENGMRFSGKLSKSDYEGITAAYKTVKFGMFIMPESYVTEYGALNQENTFGSDAIYTWGDQHANTPVVGSGNDAKYRIIHMDSVPVASGTKYTVRGSVKDFLAENLATDYTACAYIKATTTNGQIEYKFAEAHEGAVSMLELAFKALNTGNYDAPDKATEKAILEGYKTAYVTELGSEPTYSYTVNYVANGEVVDTDVVGDIAMNTPVSYTPVAPEGYVVDESNSVTEGHVYASDIVLTVNLVTLLQGSLYKGEVAYLQKDLVGGGVIPATQSFVLPQAVGSVSNFMIDGYELAVQYDDATQTVSYATYDLIEWNGGEYIATFKGDNNMSYGIKITIADLLINDASEVGRFANTDLNYYIVLGSNVDATEADYVIASVAQPTFSGTIDGKGHVITNYRIGGWSGLVYNTFSGTIKNIAFVGIQNGHGDYSGAHRGIIAYTADGATLENVYINGKSYREQLFAQIRDGGLTVNNVILDFEDGWGYKGDICLNNPNLPNGTPDEAYLGNSGTITGEENVDYFNIYGDANFYTKDLNFGDFSIGADGLYFNGTLIKSAVGTAFEGELYNGEVAYLEKTSAEETQSFVLPEGIADVSKVYVDQVVATYDATNNTVTVNTADLAYVESGIKTCGVLTDDGTLYQAKLTVADYVVKDGSETEVLKLAETDGNNYIILAQNIDASEAGEITPYTTDDFTGTIDGKGNVLSNYKVGGWQGMINNIFSGTIKDIAFVNIDNYGYRGIFSSIANGAKLENVYIQGISDREQLFATVDENGLYIDNVIIDFEDGYGSKGCVCANRIDDPANTPFEMKVEVTYGENFLNIWGDADFFTNNADLAFGDFEVKADGLYFNGNLIKANA